MIGVHFTFDPYQNNDPTGYGHYGDLNSDPTRNGQYGDLKTQYLVMLCNSLTTCERAVLNI